MKHFLSRAKRFLFREEQAKRIIASISYLQPNNRLLGKRIIVTGGGSGIGFSMAKKFTEEGAIVLIAGRKEEVLKESARAIGCHYLVFDVQKVDTHFHFIKEAEIILGGLDCLVNNAGVSLHETDFTAVTPESFDIQINTNLKGPFFLTQQFVQFLVSKKTSGAILFISSETGETADERPYGWTKAAINSMVRGLAYRVAKSHIRVNAIAPGVTASNMTGFKEDGDLYNPNNPGGRIYLPDEIAEIACFLLSDISSSISGQIITCNNGNTINARWK